MTKLNVSSEYRLIDVDTGKLNFQNKRVRKFEMLTELAKKNRK